MEIIKAQAYYDAKGNPFKTEQEAHNSNVSSIFIEFHSIIRFLYNDNGDPDVDINTIRLMELLNDTKKIEYLKKYYQH